MEIVKNIGKIKSIELNNRNNSLNLIRLILASFVLICHSNFFLGVEDKVNPIINYILYLAVPSFFVISGYLITASALKNDIITFLKKRFGRIYPAYFFSCISIVVLFAPILFCLNNNGNFDLIAYMTQSPSPISFLINSLPFSADSFTIGQTLINLPNNHWNGSAWTLIFEFTCYIAIACIIYSFKKIQIKKINFSKLIFAIYIIFLVISFFSPRNDTLPLKGWNWINTAIYFFTVFLGGSIVFLIKDKIRFSYKLLSLAILLCIGIMSFIPYHWAMELSAIPMIYIILFISMTLKSPKWVQKNDISYGIYIYAWPIQCVILSFFIYFTIPQNIYLYIVICMVVIVLYSTLSWFLIEKPILDRIRR